MSITSDLYLTRADECAAEAAAAGLDNVRDRMLRSEQAWRGMARQLLHAERLRETRMRTEQFS